MTTLKDFKEKDIAIHCETQEEYDELMELLEENGFSWWFKMKPTEVPFQKILSHIEFIGGIGGGLSPSSEEDDNKIIKAKEFLQSNKEEDGTR